MKQLYISLALLASVFIFKHTFSSDYIDPVTIVKKTLEKCKDTFNKNVDELNELYGNLETKTKDDIVNIFRYLVLSSYLLDIKMPDQKEHLLDQTAYFKTFHPVYNINTDIFCRLKNLLQQEPDSPHSNIIQMLQNPNVDADTLFTTLSQLHYKKSKDPRYKSILGTIEDMVNNISITLPPIPDEAYQIVRKKSNDIKDIYFKKIIKLSEKDRKTLHPNFNSFEKTLLTPSFGGSLPTSPRLSRTGTSRVYKLNNQAT